MKLTLTHRFHAPLAAVLSTLTDADYARALAAEHSFFTEVQVLSLVETPREVRRQVRYRGRPLVSRLLPFALPAAWFVWTEHSVLDRASATLHFDNVPELEGVRAKVLNRGTMLFRSQYDEHGDVVTTRESRFELALTVSRPYARLGESVLGLIGGQLESALDEEARFLARYLGRAAHANSRHEAALTA